jgi:hypothetical protein
MKHVFLILISIVMPVFAQNETRWEYAMILETRQDARVGKSIGFADICYAQPSGCKLETLQIDFETTSFNPQPAWAKNQILAKAMHHLGEMGYELVSLAPAQRGGPQEVLFFKRPRK